MLVYCIEPHQGLAVYVRTYLLGHLILDGFFYAKINPEEDPGCGEPEVALNINLSVDREGHFNKFKPLKYN